MQLDGFVLLVEEPFVSRWTTSGCATFKLSDIFAPKWAK